jgi:hypothetical protein
VINAAAGALLLAGELAAQVDPSAWEMTPEEAAQVHAVWGYLADEHPADEFDAPVSWLDDPHYPPRW